jgi:hypothetical protein
MVNLEIKYELQFHLKNCKWKGGIPTPLSSDGFVYLKVLSTDHIFYSLCGIIVNVLG